LKITKALGLCLLMFACSSPPIAENEAPLLPQRGPTPKKPTKKVLVPPIAEVFTPPTVSLPQAQNTQELVQATAIHISKESVTVDGKKVAPTKDNLPFQGKSFYPIVWEPLAEALELKKEAIISEQGSDNFTRQVLLYAEKDTPAELIWVALYSAAAVGFDEPSLIVSDSSGKPAALALTLSSEGFLRGVRLSQDGATQPGLLGDALAPRLYMNDDLPAAITSYYPGVGRTSSGPEVIDGKADIKGSLDKDIIRRVIRRAMPGIKFCYEQALQSNPSLVGKIKISFVIAPNGAVSSAAPSKSLDNDLDACATRKIAQLSFPAPQGGGTVSVTYPFVFQSPGNEYDEAAVAPASQPNVPKGLPLFTVAKQSVSLRLPSIVFNDEAKKLASYLTQNPLTGPVLLRAEAGSTYESLIQTADICIQAKLSTISFPPPLYKNTDGGDL
jgi:hypothetical protein